MYTKNALIARVNRDDVRHELRHRLLDVEVEITTEEQWGLLRSLSPYRRGDHTSGVTYFNWLDQDAVRFPARKTKRWEARAPIPGFRSAWVSQPRAEFAGYFRSSSDLTREMIIKWSERLFETSEVQQIELVGQPVRYKFLEHNQRNAWLWLHKFHDRIGAPVNACPTCGRAAEWKESTSSYRIVAFVVGHSDTLVQADWLVYQKKGATLLGTG